MMIGMLMDANDSPEAMLSSTFVNRDALTKRQLTEWLMPKQRQWSCGWTHQRQISEEPCCRLSFCRHVELILAETWCQRKEDSADAEIRC